VGRLARRHAGTKTCNNSLAGVLRGGGTMADNTTPSLLGATGKARPAILRAYWQFASHTFDFAIIVGTGACCQTAAFPQPWPYLQHRGPKPLAITSVNDSRTTISTSNRSAATSAAGDWQWGNHF